MRRELLCLGTVLFAALLTLAQDTPRVEVFGGYSYLNADSNSLTDRVSLNGWEASVTANANKVLGVEVGGSGYYKNNVLDSGVDARDYAILGGPRLNYRNLFVHALFGFDHLTGNYLGASASQNGFAMALGGGVVAPISEHFGIRGSVDYAMTQHNVIGNLRFDQNNFRASAGIVFRFGSIGAPTRSASNDRIDRASSVPTRGRTTSGPAEIPELGLTVMEESGEPGVRVLSVNQGGPAATAGLVTHDRIVSVNGSNVASVDELKNAISGSKDRKLTLRYMYLGTPQYRTIEVKF